MSEKPLRSRMRMASFRDKLQVFFLGLLTGLVLGGGFFVLKLDDYVKQLSFYKSLTEDTDKNGEGSDKIADEPQEKKPTKPKTKKDKPVASYSADSVPGAYLDGDTLAADSLDAPPSVFDPDDEIIVKKDELVGQRTLAVTDLDAAPKDTALEKLSGIREPQLKTMQVEFWRSPLNYRGYKMSRNKLVLFGTEPADEVSLYKSGDEMYLRNPQGVFRIQPGGDFRQAERVTDAAVLARLK